MTRYFEAWTMRGVSLSRFDRPGPAPLKHALSESMPKASRTGKNYRAVCGASVGNVSARAFVAGLARSCRKCAKAIES
jgi:hypothetical protein